MHGARTAHSSRNAWARRADDDRQNRATDGTGTFDGGRMTLSASCFLCTSLHLDPRWNMSNALFEQLTNVVLDDLLTLDITN